MAGKLLFKRILLKISGESLKGQNEFGYSSDGVNQVVERLKDALKTGVQIALVIGGGNIWRGAKASEMDRVRADQMGMLATVMNAIRLEDALRKAGVKAHIHASADMRPFANRFERDLAEKQLNNGELVIFAGGTGSPYFTTDTTAALRALEMNCEAVVKATKVNGIYTADPMKFPDAQKFDTLTFKQSLEGGYKIMDSAAFSMCADNNLAIIVCKFFELNSLEKILTGDFSAGTVVKG